jgi:hypothetical protein
LLFVLSLPSLAQNSHDAGVHSLDPWNGVWRQKPLRQYIALSGRWAITSQPGLAAFTASLPALFSRDGEFSCTRDFFLEAGLSDRPLRFVVGPVNYRCQVLVNDYLVGNHEGGGAAFAFDLNPEHLLPGQNNKLRLIVDTRLQPLTTIPARMRPQAGRYAPGIFENLFIEALPDFAIDSVRCMTSLQPENLAADIQIKTTLRIRDKLPAPPAAPAPLMRKLKEPDPNQISLVAELLDSTGTQRLAGSSPVVVEKFDDLQQEFTLSFRLDQPRLWAPGQPHLDVLRVAVVRGMTVIDEWRETIGLRSIQWEKNRLMVNGQPTILRGIEWAGTAGATSAIIDSATCNEIARRVRDWGGNLLRVVGQPAPPQLLDACDRQGIFLLEELPIYYLTPAHLSKNRFSDIARSMLGEMIARDRNHPSALAWGLAANTPLLEIHKNIFQRLRNLAQLLDDRPLYAVTEPSSAKSWEGLADFLIIDSFEKDVARDIASFKSAGRPVLSRFGFSLAAVGGAAEQANDNAAQQRQANLIKNAFDEFNANREQLSGYVIVALQDWRVDAPLLRAGFRREPDVYPAGLVSGAGEPRLAFQVTRAVHREVRGPALPPQTFKLQHPDVYAGVGIGLIVVVLFFINRDKRLLGNLRRAFAHPHGFYMDIVENRKIPSGLTVLVAVAEGCLFAIVLSAFLFAYRNSQVLDNLLMMLCGEAEVKRRLVWLVWHPGWFIVAGAAAYLLCGLALTGLLRLVAFVFGRRASAFQLFTMVFWAATNVLFLGIVAPFFYGLLASGKFIQPLLFGILVVSLWFLLRMFRGMRVIFGVNYFKTFILFLIVFGGIGLSVYLYYDRTQALWDYAGHYWSVLVSK